MHWGSFLIGVIAAVPLFYVGLIASLFIFLWRNPIG